MDTRRPRPFRHEAENRDLPFDVDLDPTLGRSIVTDSKRLQQVLKNLLSNAFKFTDAGRRRRSTCRPADGGWTPDHPVLEPGAAGGRLRRVATPASASRWRSRRSSSRRSSRPTPAPAASTAAPASASPSAANWRACSAAKSICAARPARAAPSRSICRCTMPARRVAPRAPASRRVAGSRRRCQLPTQERVDRARCRTTGSTIEPGDPVLLIVEDDPHYARVAGRSRPRQGLQGAGRARAAPRRWNWRKQFQPTAISLDIFLPDMLGWTVLSQLKQDPLTRHIPVQIVTLDEDRQHGLARGAFSFVTKPTTTEGVERGAVSRIKEYARPRAQAPADRRGQCRRADEHHASCSATTTSRSSPPAPARRRSTALRDQPCDCVVLDLRLPDMTRLRGARTASATTKRWRTCRSSCSPAGNCRPRRTRSFTPWRAASWSRAWSRRSACSTRPSLFLHRVVTDLPVEKQRMLEQLQQLRRGPGGPDRRCWSMTTRATSSRCRSVLERRGMKVLTATTGREAIDAGRVDTRTSPSC